MIDKLIQKIVATWDSDMILYKGFPAQDVDYPFVTFDINPAAMERTFCSDIPSWSVIFTVWTQSKSSTSAQTELNSIKTIYNRTNLSGILYNKIMNSIVVKDLESHFYTGSSTYLMAIEEGV